MGGGTGTGATPVIAELAKKLGISTVVLATKPFAFEGQERTIQAEQGLKELETRVDKIFCFQNDDLLESVTKDTSIRQAFEIADDEFLKIIQSLLK